MTFRADRPFHPQRLALVLDHLQGLAQQGILLDRQSPRHAAIWSQTGLNVVIEPAQY
jgi:hypothetical protein